MSIIATQLSNGLQVRLKEMRTTPLISFWVWYKVGSRDEPSGRTGLSHWLEHMQFKGTPQFPGGQLDKAISREGGHWNALTFQDWTTYYEVLPSAKIDIALRLEADRMIHTQFDPQEIESERKVVIAERQGEENEPVFRLGEEVGAAAYRVHPYHHEIIGDMADLLALQPAHLEEHYRTFYIPNNALISVAGDFEAEAMLERIRDLFEGIPPKPEPLRLDRPEPPQHGERRVDVIGPGDATFVQMAYHVPNGKHADFFALTVLDSLLTGPSGLNMFGGGGISNKTSRLYRALVEKEIVVGIGGGLQATIDPYLYTIFYTMRPDHTSQEAIRIVDDEIQRLQDNPPPQEEVKRAVKQARALFAYGSESITNQAFWLGFAEMFADYSWFENYLSVLESITPQDVQRVAQNYLRPRNRTTGIYLPDGEDEDEEDE